MGSESLYDIYFWFVWCGKVLAQMVESTWLCEKTWVWVLCMPIVCYSIYYYYFDNMLDHIKW